MLRYLKTNFFLFTTILILFSTLEKGNSQNVELEIYECNSFKSTHYLEKSFGSMYSVQLEQEIAPGLWALVSKIRTDEPYYIFNDLKNGNYRATLVETKVTGVNEKIFQKISNEVKIDCPVQSRVNANDQKFKIYPNPAENEIFINAEKEFDKSSHFTYEIINILGQKVSNGCLHSDNERIKLSRLESGTYFIIFKDNGQISSTKKLLINKKD